MKHFNTIIELDEFLKQKGWEVFSPIKKEFKTERRNIKLDLLLHGLLSPDFSYELNVDETCQVLTVYDKNNNPTNCYSIKI